MQDADPYLKERADLERNQVWSTVSVIIGIVAYLLLFVKSMFFTVLFGVQACKTDLPECIAIEGFDQPLGVLELLAPFDSTVAT